MSKLILQMQTSIDGFVSSTVPQSRWQQWDWGAHWPWTADLRAYFNSVFVNAAGIVLSRPMVDQGYLEHWRQTSDQHPHDPDYFFARRIGGLPKYVLSRSGGPGIERSRTTVLNGDVTDSLPRAEQDAGGDLLCFGGTRLARALLRGDLVDELQLFINPGFAGAGDRIFDASSATTSFSGIDAAAYECGVVVTRWARPSANANAESREGPPSTTTGRHPWQSDSRRPG